MLVQAFLMPLGPTWLCSLLESTKVPLKLLLHSAALTGDDVALAAGFLHLTLRSS